MYLQIYLIMNKGRIWKFFFMNLLENDFKCVECKCKKLIKDYDRQELYCSKCGLVLVDTTITTLKQKMLQKPIKEPKKRKTEKIQYLRMKKKFYDFMM